MKARDNPYRSERVEALAFRAEDFDWKNLEARLAAAKGRGAIVGPEGHGKTTLLLEWYARRTDAVLLRVKEGQRRLTSEQRGEIGKSRHLFLDSAEQFGWWGWRELRWLSRRARSVVITSHRPGLLPTVFTCRTSAILLGELMEELTGRIDEHATLCLWQQHKGNVRLALRDLYDAQAGIAGNPAHYWWQFLSARESKASMRWNWDDAFSSVSARWPIWSEFPFRLSWRRRD